MNAYTPRRQAKKFLDGDCPAGVLAIFDNGGRSFDRYTVIYREVTYDHTGTPWLGYRAMSEHPAGPQGFGIYGEFTRWDMAGYRRRAYRESAKWSSLPPDVQAAVRNDCSAEGGA